MLATRPHFWLRFQKNSLRLCCIPLLLAGLAGTACVSTESAIHSETIAKEKEKEVDEPWLMKPFLFLVKRHRELGTHLDGPRCPMFPSCAAYAQKAVQKHGFAGLMMFVDRLFFREVGELKTRYMVSPKHFSRHRRYYDPVEDALPIFKYKRPSLLKEDFSR